MIWKHKYIFRLLSPFFFQNSSTMRFLLYLSPSKDLKLPFMLSKLMYKDFQIQFNKAQTNTDNQIVSHLGLQGCDKTLGQKATWGGSGLFLRYNYKEENLGQELKGWKKKLKQKQWRTSYSLDPRVFLQTLGSHNSQRAGLSHINL